VGGNGGSGISSDKHPLALAAKRVYDEGVEVLIEESRLRAGLFVFRPL